MPASDWYSDGLRFTCTQCGNCCTGSSGYVFFTDAEAATIADHLHVSIDEFHKQFAHRTNGYWSLNEVDTPPHGYDCVFLQRDPSGKALCSIYPVRPKQCRTWPFWHDNLDSPKAWQRAAQRCPGMNQGLSGAGAHYPLQQIRIIRDSNPTT